MDPYQGFEVGAEVELNDGTSALEDSTTVKVENKQDLPLWHHLHYFEDSSSDESLDHQHVISTSPEVKNLEILNYVTDIKSLIEGKEPLERKMSMFSTSEDLHTGLHIHDVRRDDQPIVWSSMYNKDLQDSACQLAPGFEDISHTEIIIASDYGQSPSDSTELYAETILSHEEDTREGLGKYSYYNANTQFAGSVKPWVRNHKCPRCGRQFGRLYNLEKHMCIKMAVGFSQQSACNPEDIFFNSRKKINISAKRSEQNQESMNRLEKMCVEAQKELQNLQEHYRKDDEAKPLPSIDPSDIQVWSQEGLSEVGKLVPANKISYKSTVTCQRCRRKFRSRCNLEFHVCPNEETNVSISQELTVPQNITAIDLANSVATSPLVRGEQDLVSHTEHNPPPSDKPKSDCTSSDYAMSPEDSKENLVGPTKVPGKAVEIFKCQQCRRVYNKHCSYATHIRWHMKERDFASSVTTTVAKTEGQQPDRTTLQTDVSPVVPNKHPVSSQKSAQDFTCQHCGRVFNKHCSYATHTRWHLKERDPLSSATSPTAQPAGEGEETSRQTDQVPSIAVNQQESDRKKASAVEIFTCQHCGRVFNKRCSYATHMRWHMKERELETSVKADAQRVLAVQEEYREKGDTKDMVDHHSLSEGDGGEGLPFSRLGGDGYFQIYGSLAHHRHLGGQYNLYADEGKANHSEDTLSKQVEPSQQKSSTVVPESIFELIVGTEDVCEVSLTKDDQVIQNIKDLRTAEDTEETMSGTQTDPLTIMEPSQQPISLPLMLPCELVTRLLKRPKPPHRCRDCGTRFYQSWRLKWHRHKDAVNRNRWKKHRCDCGRLLAGSLHFLRHQLQHLSDTAFICAVCGKSLRGYRHLQAHSWLHPLVSQFQCKCGARFTQLPRYLWHSLLNKTKDRKKPKERNHSGTPSP